MELNSFALDEHRLERLNTQAVQSRRTIQQHRVLLNDFVENIPHDAFFVSNNDIRRAELNEPLEPVIAVDDAAIEIVKITRRETAAVQRDKGPQIRRNHRNDGEDHPLGTIAAVLEGREHLQSLREFL